MTDVKTHICTGANCQAIIGTYEENVPECCICKDRYCKKCSPIVSDKWGDIYYKDEDINHEKEYEVFTICHKNPDENACRDLYKVYCISCKAIRCYGCSSTNSNVWQNYYDKYDEGECLKCSYK